MYAMKNKVAGLSLAAAVVMTPMVSIVGASTASAVPSSSASATPITDALDLTWDGTNPGTGTQTFFGTPVTVPGDSASRTVTVKNNGPSDGTLTAKITNVKIVDADKSDVHHNSAHVDPDGVGNLYKGAGDQGDWYSDLDLSWAMGSSNGHNNFRKLNAAGDTQIYQSTLAKGASIPVKMTYSIPLEATSGNKANVQKREASFDVVFTISGDTPTSPPPPSTTPPTTPATTPPTQGSNPPPTKTTTTSVPSSSSPGVKIDTGNQFDMRKALLGAFFGALLLGGGGYLLHRSGKGEHSA